MRRKQFLHVPVTDLFAIPQNLIYINSQCRVASQLDEGTLSSNVFPLVRFRKTVSGNLFNLDSRFAKADRRLGPIYMKVGVPRLVR